ncbi:DUF2975 domain-containing protein [soil metagenome]
MGVRALGPGSVSSFLKAVLDVVYYALYVAAAVTAVAMVASLLVQPFIGARGGRVDQPFGPFTDLLRTGPALAGVLALGLAYIALLIVAVERTRRVFSTMTAGDPFDPQNVNRLRVIGAALGAMELLGWAARVITHAVIPQALNLRTSLNLTAWFSVLVVFVLADVFREGARLRAEAELTV